MYFFVAELLFFLLNDVIVVLCDFVNGTTLPFVKYLLFSFALGTVTTLLIVVIDVIPSELPPLLLNKFLGILLLLQADVVDVSVVVVLKRCLLFFLRKRISCVCLYRLLPCIVVRLDVIAVVFVDDVIVIEFECVI
jgi:hypothetical protein